MSWNGKNETRANAQEKGFEISVAGHKVPGVYWKPNDRGDRLVMLGHGGSTHKKAEYIVQIADLLAQKGIASFAIDGPGHGERAEKAPRAGLGEFETAWNDNGGTETVISDWHASLDFIESVEGARPTGWWGLSMGTMMGLPVSATDNRVKIALLGLMGTWGPNGDDLKRLARQLTCPVRFLVQWDDEVVPRENALKLFGLIGSTHKTLHANPGTHFNVPAPEFLGSVDYLDRYLS